MSRIAVISTVRSPVEQLKRFIAFNLNSGIDQIFLFFDDPQDAGLHKLSSLEKVHLIRCDDKYWKTRSNLRPSSIEERQTINVNEGAKIARSKDFEWIIHIDSDELIYPLYPIKQVLAKSSAEAIRFSVMEAVPCTEKYNHIFEPYIFRKKPRIIPMNITKIISRLLGCNKAFFGNEYFRGHMASKMAVRISSNITCYGIHNATKDSGKLNVEDTNDIRLLHFDCVGFDNWQAKWENRLDGSGKATRMRNNRKEQLSLYERARIEGKNQLINLYRRLYFIPDYERRVLYCLGMLSFIHIDRNMFDHPPQKMDEN